jgi:hypothetical protein
MLAINDQNGHSMNMTMLPNWTQIISLLKKMVISGTRNPIIHKWYKRNERIELYKGKDTVLSTVYILHTITFFHKITKGH